MLSVRLLPERMLHMLLFIEMNLSRDTAANTGHISTAYLFQPVLSYPNSIFAAPVPEVVLILAIQHFLSYW